MSLNPPRFDLGGDQRVLSTRHEGRRVGHETATMLADHGRLLLNFHNVIVASPPFLDEVVTALRAVLAVGDGRILLITGCNDDVRETLEMVLSRQKMALTLVDEKGVQLLGGNVQLAETLKAARELKTFTAPELAEHLKLKLPALHQRLAALREAGALVREDDPTATRGRRGKFHAPTQEDIDAARAASDDDQSAAVVVSA